MIYSENPAGIYVSNVSVIHREEEYDSFGFDTLLEIQERHFWYLGRHRFLYQAFLKEFRQCFGGSGKIKAIDLGGGCGGWSKYLIERSPKIFIELALGDSSLRALEMAKSVVGANVKRYQIDLLHLHWSERWDVAFLLDVLEHIPNDVEVLSEIRKSLHPGGLLFVTTPALKFFWSYNDDAAHHVRRYARRDFRILADKSGFQLLDSRYFMFFLSPLLLLSRIKGPNLDKMSQEQIQKHLKRTHKVPVAPINQFLRLIFSLETPLGLWIPFPWGTSILGVFQKPR